MALSREGGSSPSPTRQEEESPKNKSTPFSISAILSEDVGPRKSSAVGGVDKQSSMVENGGGGGGSPVSTISLSQAANLMMSPVAGSTMIRPALHPAQMSAGPYPPMFLHHTPTHPSHNNSLSMSPFNASLLQVLGQQSTPTSRDDVFEDSLGMLSTVALYHGELSNTSVSSTSTPMQERLAAMRISSASDLSEGSGESADTSDGAVGKKSATPYILKRDKRRRRKSSGSFHSHHSDLRHFSEESPTLNVGFLSPSSVEKSPSKLKQLTFSPSIFLSRPERTSASILSTSEHSSASGSLIMSSPNSEPESGSGINGSGFVTSTPIKSDKENVLNISPLRWSPPLPSGSSKRKQLRQEQIEPSSESDSELPLKRPRTMRKSRARTKLSPLLENACSPIAKANPPQPSPLVTASIPAYASMYVHVPTSSVPIISIQDHDRMTSSQALYAPYAAPPISQPTYPHSFMTSPCSAAPGQLLMAQSHMYMPLSTTQLLTPHCYNSNMTHSTQWSVSSPISVHWGKTGPLQSVPPWFIFSNNKSEGKRSRLTEAINHSISETPSQNPKLPPGWTKLACGQTDDQKTLTERARSFLQCRPRQLTFDDPVN